MSTPCPTPGCDGPGPDVADRGPNPEDSVVLPCGTCGRELEPVPEEVLVELAASAICGDDHRSVCAYVSPTKTACVRVSDRGLPCRHALALELLVARRSGQLMADRHGRIVRAVLKVLGVPRAELPRLRPVLVALLPDGEDTRAVLTLVDAMLLDGQLAAGGGRG